MASKTDKWIGERHLARMELFVIVILYADRIAKTRKDKISYYNLHNKSCFSENLHVIWSGKQFKVGPFFLKHPVLIFQSYFFTEIYIAG